jgi:DNA-binding LytR/AlgR family response regulator
MNTYRAIAVDDEYLALNLIENFLTHISDIELVGKYKSPMMALEFLSSQPVDLLFLDIQMPVLSGNNLLRTLKNPPVTIMTTAYSDYAVEAFDLNAVDYLLKPFSFERFLQAVNKAKEQLANQKEVVLIQSSEAKNFTTIKADGDFHKVFFEEILFIEGWKEYVRIYLQNGKKLVTLESLRNLEETLPEGNFLRVHKSYIVSTARVTTLTGNMLVIGEHKVPVSRTRKEEVVGRIFGS